jgi:hypothetical protein
LLLDDVGTVRTDLSSAKRAYVAILRLALVKQYFDMVQVSSTVFEKIPWIGNYQSRTDPDKLELI